MKVLNTMSRRLEDVVPMEPGHIRMYTCGPTVYDFAHIGNFRAYVFEDILRRTLKFIGFKVTQVMNLTDVDDKTIRGANTAGVALRDYTAKYKKAFFDDLAVLGIEPAEQYPAATDHVPEMIEIISRLVASGHAYRSEDGSVYFNVAKFPAYGSLAHLDRAGLKSGARVAQDEYEKESASDFALWKAWDESDGPISWESPWGRGRPGWHIECSAMSTKYLGASFDIHTGGIDNIFPHHENEIAQTEAATGQRFVKYWMHCNHLVVDGKKMSKSLGNFYTLRQLFDKGWAGREVRYVLLSAQYRQSLNFTFDALAGARASLARIDSFMERLTEKIGAVSIAKGTPEWASKAAAKFKAGLEDDLNVPESLSALFEVILEGNKAFDSGSLDSAGALAVRDVLMDFDKVLGVIAREGDKPSLEVLRLVDDRQKFRAAKAWADADKARDALAAHGWMVQDTPSGPKLRRLVQRK